MTIKGNNILYYEYDHNIKNDVINYLSNSSNLAIDINNYESILDSYYEIYNRFNKYGITVNKLHIKDEITFCDEVYYKLENIFNEIIKQIISNVNLNEIINSKYYILIKNHRDQFVRTPEMNLIYESNNVSFNDLINYVNLRSKEVKSSSFLNDVLNQIGLSYNSLNQIIKEGNEETLKVSNEESLYDLEEAKEILISLLKNNYDESILIKLLDNVYMSDERSGATIAYGEIPIININNVNGKVNIIALVHELAHAYHYYCNETNEIQNFDSRSDFSESFAIATELFTSKKLGLKNQIIDDYNNFFFDTIYSIKIQNYIETNRLTLTEETLKKEYPDYENYIRYILDNYYDIYYLEGFIVGIILSNKIENYNINELKQLLSFNSNIPLNEILNNFGINLNDELVLDEYLSYIKKEYKSMCSQQSLK